MPQPYSATTNWPWEADPARGFDSLIDVPFGGPSTVHFADQQAFRSGYEGLMRLPERVRQFLLRNPARLTVSKTSPVEEALIGHGFYDPEALRIGLSNATKAEPAISMEEFLHAADDLASGFKLGEPLMDAAEASNYRSILRGPLAYDERHLPTELFAIPANALNEHGSNVFTTPLAKPARALIRNPRVRQLLLDALEQIPRMPGP